MKGEGKDEDECPTSRGVVKKEALTSGEEELWWPKLSMPWDAQEICNEVCGERFHELAEKTVVSAYFPYASHAVDHSESQTIAHRWKNQGIFRRCMGCDRYGF